MSKRDLYFVTRAGFWLISIVVVISIGILNFPKEDSALNLWGALYYSIRLFILEHDLPHFPRSNPLVFIYFFAPLVSLSIVGTALNYLYQLTPSIISKWKRGHVVVCGVGRTGKLIVETLSDQGIKVTGIDSDSPKHFEKFRIFNNVPVINGDFLSAEVLKRAGAKNASDIVFATSNDLLNIEGVIGAYDWLCKNKTLLSETTLWVHVSNETLTNTVKQSLQTEGKLRIRFFDTFHIAAERMVDKFFDRSVRSEIEELTILGFGKFGRDLFEVLIREKTSSEDWNIRVVDIHDRKKEVEQLALELGLVNNVKFLKADIHDLELAEDKTKAFFLCTDDDIKNLTTALTLTNKAMGSCIYVRMGMWPLAAVKEHLSENRGLVFVNINDLVVEGIKDIRRLLRKLDNGSGAYNHEV